MTGRRWGGRQRAIAMLTAAFTRKSTSRGLALGDAPPARRQKGLASIEYALIASLIAMAIIVGVSGLRSATGGIYQHVADSVAAAVGGQSDAGSGSGTGAGAAGGNGRRGGGGVGGGAGAGGGKPSGTPGRGPGR